MRRLFIVLGLAASITLLAVLSACHVVGEGLEQTDDDSSYVCGRFGDKMMRIDRRYLFLSRVEYQDVDYWSPGYRKVHAGKGCDDQIQNAALDVEWPAMTPSNSFRNLGKIDFVSITLNQRSVWDVEEQGESKDFFDATELLLNYLSHIDTFERVNRRSFEEISAVKVFNYGLDLYEMTPYDNERSKMIVFWREVEGKGVSPVIECLYFKKMDDPSCQFYDHIPNYGDHTSYLKIYFHADLLPQWKELHSEAIQLIDHFTVKGKVQ